MSITDSILTKSLWWQKTAGRLVISRFDKNSGTNIVFIGFAPTGSATSAAVWIIVKISYDGSNDPTSILWAPQNVKWDDITTLTYT